MATIGEDILETGMDMDSPILADEECLKERKWWCFLLRCLHFIKHIINNYYTYFLDISTI